MKSFKRTEKGTLKHKDRNWVILYGPSLRDDDGCFCSPGMRFLRCSTGFVLSMCIAGLWMSIEIFHLMHACVCQEVCVLGGLKMKCLPWVMQNGNKKSCEGLRS